MNAADLLAKLGKKQQKLNFECSLRAEIITKNQWNELKIKAVYLCLITRLNIEGKSLENASKYQVNSVIPRREKSQKGLEGVKTDERVKEDPHLAHNSEHLNTGIDSKIEQFS